MNRYDTLRDLDGPSNEEVEILHDICQDASASTSPPYKALFTSYGDFFAAHGLDTARDPSIFRWLMRVAERVRPERRNGTPVDFVQQLKSLMKDREIEIVYEGQHGDKDAVKRSADIDHPQTASANVPVRRRVSFDDARMEETWLSEHSKPLSPMPQAYIHGALHKLPYRGRSIAPTEVSRARSNSSQRGRLNQQLASEQPQTIQPSTVRASEYGDLNDPTLLLEPSQSQLEQNAEAFLATSELRTARQCLHDWHNGTLLTQGRRAEAIEIAISRDRRTLLKQSLDIWLVSFRRRSRELEHDIQLKSILQGLNRRKDCWLLAKAFSHWDESARHQKRATAVAERHMMKVKYFDRWRSIAIENALKVRSIQLRKYVVRWRDRTSTHEVVEERAHAHHAEALVKACFHRWFWAFCSRRVDGWHEQQIQRQSLHSWHSQLDIINAQEQEAENLRDRNLARRMIRKLVSILEYKQQAVHRAKEYHDRRLTSACLQSLYLNAQLAPIASKTSNRVDLDLLRRTMKVWQYHVSSSRKAAAASQKRILQSAWTAWNDALRCEALTQRMDERILVESLYKWVLQERLRSFEKTRGSKRVQWSLRAWLSKYEGKRSALNAAFALFKDREQQRRTRSSLLRLYSVFRVQENLDRTAVEFANTRALPAVLETWKDQAKRAQQMKQWAGDARFYCLVAHTLQLWRNKTSEHKRDRRREAYAQVRSKIKYKIVKDCFARWHAKAISLRQLCEEAGRRQQARSVRFGIGAYDSWREKTMLYDQLDRQATLTDHQKLQTSGLSILISRNADLSALEEQAISFRQESNLVVVSTALKRIQWGAFTASRRTETADALWARNRDQHVRQMLRHLASEAGRRRAAKLSASRPEPESPSLRPASRLAARTESQTTLDEPTTLQRTPAYMQTPSRSRRVSRFRPLPTPAMVTPMAFSAAYYVTTPAPLSAALPADVSEEGSNDFEGLTPQITHFARKLRAGGINPAIPPSALRSSIYGTVGNGRNAGGTNKSVRFVRSGRFSGSRSR